MNGLNPVSWHGLHGEAFTFSIPGYEFPEITEGHDANRLKVRVDARNEEGSWSKEVACMLSYEVEWLHRWLEYVPDGMMQYSDFGVLEMDLSFKYLVRMADAHRITVVLRYGLSFGDRSEDISILSLHVSDVEYGAMKGYLRDVMERFPPRGDTGERAKKLPGPRIL